MFSFLFVPGTFLNILYSKPLRVISSRNVRDQIPNLYKKTSKTIVQYVTIFIFFG
jgi:hypothetical protein